MGPAPAQMDGSLGESVLAPIRDCIFDKLLRDKRTGRPVMRRGKDGQMKPVIIPAAYSYNKMAKAQDAYVLTPEEVTKISTTIQNVLRWGTFANEVIPGVGPFIQTEQIGRGKTEYEWYKWLNIPPPELTKDFLDGSVVKPMKAKDTKSLFGMHYDWSLTRVEVDAMQMSMGKKVHFANQQMAMMEEITAELARWRDWYIFRGTDCPGLNSNIGITGLLNDAELPDPGLDGTDLTGIGSVFTLAVKLANHLINLKHKPPFVLDMSYGVVSQANVNRNATSDNTDYKLITEYTGQGNSPIFSAVRMNPHLIDSETETNSSGAMVAYSPNDAGMANYFLAESYPMSAVPLPPHGFSAVDFKLLWMGRPIIKRPTAIAKSFGHDLNVLS